MPAIRVPFWGRASLITSVVALSVACLSQTSLASSSPVPPVGPVSGTPASGTPALAPTGVTEQVRQLVQCGNTMYAVGTFSAITSHGTTYARSNIFSFSANAPYTLTSWNPDVRDTTTGAAPKAAPLDDGPFQPTDGIVNSITFNGTDCSHAYIGGLFSSVHGSKVHDIAELSTTTGDVVPSFGHDANGEVETLLGVRGHILAGGFYTAINGSSADAYMTSLSPTTGADDGFLHLHISGHYQYYDVTTNPTEVHNQQLSHSGTLDLVEGDFTSVGGLSRQQIFMLDLASDPASVTGWTSPEWDGSDGQPPHGYNYQCGDSIPFYIRGAAWSPNDSTVYIADTGFHPWNVPATARAPACAMRRRHSLLPRPPSGTTGSTTPAATRSIRSRPIRARPTSAATTSTRRTPTAARALARAPSSPRASRVCRRRPDASPSIRPALVASAPTTCSSPPPVSGSRATTLTEATPVPMWPGMPASACSPIAPDSPSSSRTM